MEGGWKLTGFLLCAQETVTIELAGSATMVTMSGRVTFGAFELNLDSGELSRAGRAVKLRPQPMRVLCLLVSKARTLVSRDDIRRLLWGESTFVDYDQGVDYCVYRIRSILGDNVQAPRYVETLAGRGYRFIAPVTRARPFAEPTLAVLPFANLNGDPDKESFADGVTDALITELAHIPAVRVISRQSVLHLKGSTHRLQEIARDLGVDGVVEGAVLHEGGRARLTAQLVLMEPERHAWAQSYECDMSAVLATQREVARTVARCVASALRPASALVMPRRAAARAVARETTETYLNARGEFEKMTAEGILKALDYFRELTLEAPEFAPGLAWHSACLFTLGYWGHAPTTEVYPSAKHLALRAVAVDEGLARGHLVLAWTNLLLDWDLDAALREVRRAIELGPSESDAHSFYSTLLCFVGQKAEATREVEYMLKLNPAALLPNQYAAWMFLHMGQHARAEAQARRTIEAFPDSLQPYVVLGWAAWHQGRAADAVAALEQAVSRWREALSLAYLGHVFGRLGRRDEAMRLFRELEQLRARGQAPPLAFAVIHAGLGDIDAAFAWLETAYRLRDGSLFWLAGAPGLDPLHVDPRFGDLVCRLGVAPA
jgi:TolB-like protein/tetratricopeptide (TPR) repeat protein